MRSKNIKTEESGSQQSKPGRGSKRKSHAAKKDVEGISVGQGGVKAIKRAKQEKVEGPDVNEEEVIVVKQEDDGLTEYEKMRKANMERNANILSSLDLPSIPKVEREKAIRARGLGPNKRHAEVLPPRERSLR